MKTIEEMKSFERARETYVPEKVNRQDERKMQWFRDAKFGMYIGDHNASRKREIGMDVECMRKVQDSTNIMLKNHYSTYSSNTSDTL